MKKVQNAPKLSKSLKQDLFIDYFIISLGNITKACEESGIDRKTFYRWKTQKVFKEKLDHAVEYHNDLVTKKILQMALKGNKDLLKFWAKTQMKHRGFVEVNKIEHSGSIDIPTKININIPKELKKLLEKDL